MQQLGGASPRAERLHRHGARGARTALAAGDGSARAQHRLRRPLSRAAGRAARRWLHVALSPAPSRQEDICARGTLAIRPRRTRGHRANRRRVRRSACCGCSRRRRQVVHGGHCSIVARLAEARHPGCGSSGPARTPDELHRCPVCASAAPAPAVAVDIVISWPTKEPSSCAMGVYQSNVEADGAIWKNGGRSYVAAERAAPRRRSASVARRRGRRPTPRDGGRPPNADCI